MLSDEQRKILTQYFFGSLFRWARSKEERECLKEQRKEYYSRPEVKEHQREYLIEYRKRPYEKCRKREWDRQPKAKERKREYFKRPEVIKRRRDYFRTERVKQMRREYAVKYKYGDFTQVKLLQLKLSREIKNEKEKTNNSVG